MPKERGRMTFDLEITGKDEVGTIETKIAQLVAACSRQGQGGTERVFVARIASDRRASYFKDIWAAIAVACGIDRCAKAEITAWGLANWTKLNDEDGFSLSHSSLLAMQRKARILTDKKPQVPLDDHEVRRYISLNNGVIGGTGGRQRTVVELDPHSPVAAALTTGADRRDTFFEFVRGILTHLEIGALARRTETRAKGTILEFLYELHANAYEHGKSDNGVRLLRLQKHQYPRRDVALPRASGFGELLSYLQAQPERPSNGQFNLVEASVSDFGSGILDRFLATFAARPYQDWPREKLLHALLHEQLSSKSSDPNAGLGIGQALAAASAMDAFVSLRTGEFWLTMRGALDKKACLSLREGRFPKIVGTHWQLLLPDRTLETQDG
jgi:hypothetical protein